MVGKNLFADEIWNRVLVFLMEKIWRVAQDKGWSQRQLSEKAGIDPSDFNKYIGGTKSYAKKPLSALIKALDIPIDEVLYYRSPNNLGPSNKIQETNKLLEMTTEVLESDTEYAESLKANISSFYKSINHEKRIQSLESTVNRITRQPLDRRKNIEQIDFPDRRSGVDRRRLKG